MYIVKRDRLQTDFGSDIIPDPDQTTWKKNQDPNPTKFKIRIRSNHPDPIQSPGSANTENHALAFSAHL